MNIKPKKRDEGALSSSGILGLCSMLYGASEDLAPLKRSRNVLPLISQFLMKYRMSFCPPGNLGTATKFIGRVSISSKKVWLIPLRVASGALLRKDVRQA